MSAKWRSVTLPTDSNASNSASVSLCCANARVQLPGTIAAVAAASWRNSRLESINAAERQDPRAGCQATVIFSSPTIVLPSSSVQVSTTGPDSSALNLNWMYGFAEIAGSKSAANTCLPFTVQVNLLRILRGIVFPALSLRCPDSMTCDTRAFTSTMSSLVASFLSSLMRGLTDIPGSRLFVRCRLAAAAADRDLHLL